VLNHPDIKIQFLLLCLPAGSCGSVNQSFSNFGSYTVFSIAFFAVGQGNGPVNSVTIVSLDKELTAQQREVIVERALQTTDQDAEHFLKALRERQLRCGPAAGQSINPYVVFMGLLVQLWCQLECLAQVS
jgi:hypothetical protein